MTEVELVVGFCVMFFLFSVSLVIGFLKVWDII